MDNVTTEEKVTPFVGVWIETVIVGIITNELPSHPSWVCGLKLAPLGVIGQTIKSHPSWVCGLKHILEVASSSLARHTLRGCVD